MKLDFPDECKDIHKKFIYDFKSLTVDQLNDKVADIIDEFEDYGKELAEIMKILKQSPNIIHDTVQDQYLTEFEDDFGQF
jgi:hypothetical protein